MTFVSNARNFEDCLLWRALADVEHGFYIDIGAMDPIVHSTSQAFYKRGWRGIHVEPSPDFVRRLRASRPDEQVFAAVVSSEEGNTQFHVIHDTGFSTVDRDRSSLLRSTGRVVSEIEVPKITLDKLLAVAGQREIHWMKISVEGGETAVFEGWRESNIRPWIVVVNTVDPLTWAERPIPWEPSLLARGYSLACFDGLNRFYFDTNRHDIGKALRCGLSIWDNARAHGRFLEEDDIQLKGLEAGLGLSALPSHFPDDGLPFEELSRYRSPEPPHEDKELQRSLAKTENELAKEWAAIAFLAAEKTSRQGKLAPAHVVQRLFAAADPAELTTEAFRSVLGRDPSEEEQQHFESLLVSGSISKLMFVGELLLFPEARERIVAMSLSEPQPSIVTPVIAWAELTSRTGEDLVHGAFWRILGRPPTAESVVELSNRFACGELRETVIGELVLSAEAIAHARKEWPFLADRLERLAVLEGAIFVIEAYRLFAGRQPDAEFAGWVVGQPGQSFNKYKLAGELLLAPAGLLRLESRRLEDDATVARLKSAHPFNIDAAATGRALFIFCHASVEADVQISASVRSLSLTFLEADETLYFVRWDPSLRRFVLLHRAQLRSLGDQRCVTRTLANHPAAREPAVWLDSIAAKEDSWLIAPGPVRLKPDLEYLYEAEAIVEAHRLGLHTAFLFAGAEHLRQGWNEQARAEEIYMQALLLADALVPTSPQAENELRSFLVQHTCATHAPPIRLLGPPEENGDCAKELLTFMKEATDPVASLKSIYLCIAPSGPPDLSTGLGSAFAAFGVKVVPCRWDDAAGSFEDVSASPLLETGRVGNVQQWSPWIEPSDLDAPQWVIVMPGVDAGALARMPDLTSGNGLRLANILTVAPDAMGADALAALTRFDRVYATSAKAFDRFEAFLLRWRGRLTVAEDRFKFLPLRDHGGPGKAREFSDYARRLMIDMLADRPASRKHPLTNHSLSEVYTVLPHLAPRPKLSLCISTYQRDGWLELNLRNIFQQIGAPRSGLEILVIDNASTDLTSTVVQPYLDRSDFTYFCNRQNVGLVGNLAVSVQRARGEYVWIIGDDDLTTPGTIEKILRLLDEHPKIPLIYLNYGYSSEKDPSNVVDLRGFLRDFNVLDTAGPDRLARARDIAANNENFFTGLFTHVYRRDHALRAFCQDTSGRTFSTLASCVPTAKYVLTHMMDETAYWVGEQALVVNSNVSWSAYGPMFDLEHLPRCWDLAERQGTDQTAVDKRRSNRLWLIEMMWQELFENDVAGNGAYLDVTRILNRIKHLPELNARIATFREIYQRAWENGHQAAILPPEQLFSAFSTGTGENIPAA